MRRIPDILNTSLQSFVRSCSSKQSISKSVHSYSNNNLDIFDCQLLDKQTNYCNEFLIDQLTKSEFKIFKVMMELNLKHKGNLYPSLDLIASMAGCVRSTVQLAIKKFKKLNIMRTSSRGHRQSMRYQIHEFYVQNRHKIASLVKNVFMIATLLLSRPTGLSENRYPLKEKDVYFNQSIKYGEKNVALQFTDAHYEEIKKHPKWIFERTMAILGKKLAAGAEIGNHAGYFMGIFRQEAAKSHGQPSTNSRQSTNKDPKTGTQKPWVRPKTGPNAEYVPPPKREIESDFDMSMKFEMRIHTNPNQYLKDTADKYLERLTSEQQDVVMKTVHKDCKCRPELEIK